MNPESDPSTLDIIAEGLATIWSPSAEALKLQQSRKIRCLEDLIVEAERAGYEICEVDLPKNVGGFALTIEGKPHIAVNRDKSTEYRQYTVAHELGHHLLHVVQSPDPNSLLNTAMMEFQADLFASSLIVWLTPENERDEMLRQNPEFARTFNLSVLLSIVAVLTAVFVQVWFHLFPINPVLADRR